MTTCFCKDEGYPSAAFAALDVIYKSVEVYTLVATLVEDMPRWRKC
jgi:hypothetical protein